MDKKEKTLLILGLYKNEKDIVLLSIIFILLCSCKYLNAIRNLIHFKAKFHKGTSLINNVYYCRFKLILKSLLNWFKISRILNFKIPKNSDIFDIFCVFCNNFLKRISCLLRICSSITNEFEVFTFCPCPIWYGKWRFPAQNWPNLPYYSQLTWSKQMASISCNGWQFSP